MRRKLVTFEMVDKNKQPKQWPPDILRSLGCICPNEQPAKRGSFTVDWDCPIHQMKPTVKPS